MRVQGLLRALAVLAMLLLLPSGGATAVVLQRGMRTIGAAMKGVPVPANKEVELFAFGVRLRCAVRHAVW